MSNLKELFEGLKPTTETDNSNLAKELQLERLIKSTKEAIRSHIDMSGDEWTKHDEESLESLAESLSSYVAQLNYLRIKNI